MSASPVLLPYQQDLLATVARATVPGNPRVVVVEKSRRIGATWALAADGVLTAGAAREAGGQDTLYIGTSLDMAREYVDEAAKWATALSYAAGDVDEFLFEEDDPTGEKRNIKAFRISFASGFEIVALSSRPRSLRGRQGKVIIDEAAFADDLDELLKAANALLIWGGCVVILSTHNGVDNSFNQLVESCRSKREDRLPYAVLRITFDDAIKQGLYHRVCERSGTPWTAEGEVAWRAEIRASYGDKVSEELDVIPRAGGGKYFLRTLLEARVDREAPVHRWACDASFVDRSDEARAELARAWLDDALPSIVARQTPGSRQYVGVDFARSGDLTVFWFLEVAPDLRRRALAVLELRNVPFREQEQILLTTGDALERLSGAALDARGNGQYLAERARQHWGADAAVEVMLSVPWYREWIPPLKAAIEDDTFSIPASTDLIDDFRSVEVVDGVARVVERSNGNKGQRHGDGFIAAALAHFASLTLDAGPVWAVSAPNEAPDTNVSAGAFAGSSDPSSFQDMLAGWRL